MPATSRPKDRKATILEAAAELFAERGFAAVGIDDIGARVGVTGPAIYRHYKGKDAVLLAVLERASSTLADAVEGGDAVRAAVGFVLDQPALTATYLRERPGLPREAAAPLRAAERRTRKAWSGALAALRPDLDELHSVVRQSAIVGALTTGAREHRDVVRPRLDDLLVASALGVAAAPVADRVQPAREVVWQPPTTKRDEILSAALALFRARGVSGVGIDEIGAAAGISGPTVYHYFPSKAAIVIDAYDRTGERVAVGVEEALRGARSAADAIDRLVRSYVAVANENVDLIVVTSLEGDALPESERPRLSRRRRSVRDGWTGALREVRPDLTEAEARLLVRCTFPLVNHAVAAAEGREDLEEEIVGLVHAHLTAK